MEKKGKEDQVVPGITIQRNNSLSPVHLVVQVVVPAPGTPLLAGSLGSGPSEAPTLLELQKCDRRRGVVVGRAVSGPQGFRRPVLLELLVRILEVGLAERNSSNEKCSVQAHRQWAEMRCLQGAV